MGAVYDPDTEVKTFLKLNELENIDKTQKKLLRDINDKKQEQYERALKEAQKEKEAMQEKIDSEIENFDINQLAEVVSETAESNDSNQNSASE